MKILAFAATTSTTSINQQLLVHASQLLSEGLAPDSEIELLDLNDYELPIYSKDRELADGVPDRAKQLFAKIGEADALIIALAEHNGSYTAAFKNTYDWMSRIDMKVYQAKPLVLLATSPGRGGGKTILAAAASTAPRFGAELRAQLSIPSFHHNFDTEAGVLTDPELSQQLESALTALIES